MTYRSYHGHFVALTLPVQKLYVKALPSKRKSDNVKAVLLTHTNSFDLGGSSSSNREVTPLDAYDQ
jgi:hypothetical protein